MTFETAADSYARTTSDNASVCQFHIEGFPQGLVRIQALLLSCIGLTNADDNTQPLFDPTLSPWRDMYASLKNLERKHYIKEIDRRYDFLLVASSRDPKLSRPRPNQWTLPDLKNILLPIPLMTLTKLLT